MHSVCDLGRSVGLSHAILGGREGVAERVAATLATRYPGLTVALAAGLPMQPPGHRPGAGEDADALARLADAKADVLWLGLGSPRQELWLEANRDILTVPVRAGVGAAFDFIAGTVPQAPRPLRSIGRGGWPWTPVAWVRATPAPSRPSSGYAPATALGERPRHEQSRHNGHG
jgi:N-acetylglucosaminyldiphosphoundecaprenol N-acetyl-beta-D-mannosaminyltransferase